MRIKINNNDVIERRGFDLSGQPVGVLNGALIMSSKEKKKMIETCNFIWKNIYHVSPSFQGHIRFDLIPKFSHSPVQINSNLIDIGEMRIKGIYEVNTRSPECAMATEAMHLRRPDLRKEQPSATQRLSKAIKSSFGKELIVVLGSGLVKQSWGPVYIKAFKKEGLRIKVLSIEEFQKTYCFDLPIYLCGDFRREGPSEFPKNFIHHVDRYCDKDLVFNSIPNGRYISDKSLLLANGDPRWNEIVGRNLELTEEYIDFAIKAREGVVLKPFLGSSGKNVLIGKVFNRDQEGWKKAVYNALLQQEAHGLFEARWLPKLQLPQGKFALDVNPSFWANGDELEYLYTVSRIDSWERYGRKRVINVTQGAGFAGTIIDS